MMDMNWTLDDAYATIEAVSGMCDGDDSVLSSAWWFVKDEIERLNAIIDGRAGVDDLAEQQGVKPCEDIRNLVIPDAGDFTAEFDADSKEQRND